MRGGIPQIHQPLCGGFDNNDDFCSARSKGSGTAHVMVVMMENEGASNIIGNSALPYVTSLADDYGSATNSYALAHPSLPNYLTIVSGSNQGITGDQSPSAGKFPKVPTLADQLAAAGVSERAYAENLPAQPTLDAGVYAVRHNPWEYFPECEDRRRRRVDSDPRPQRTESSGFRVVHAEPDRRRPHRGPDRHRGLPAG